MMSLSVRFLLLPRQSCRLVMLRPCKTSPLVVPIVPRPRPPSPAWSLAEIALSTRTMRATLK
jgi:hypothetical protein